MCGAFGESGRFEIMRIDEIIACELAREKVAEKPVAAVTQNLHVFGSKPKRPMMPHRLDMIDA